MKFNAIIEGLSAFKSIKKEHLVFTKAHILFNKDFDPPQFHNTELKHDINYSLKEVEIDGKIRYEITFGTKPETRKLIVDEANEKKLRRIHKLDWYSNYPIKYDILKAAITAGFAILVGILINLPTCLKQSRLYERQEKRLDSLSGKVDSLTNLLNAP